MNAGQLLLALSPLSSGNAGQHLLAIQLGSGAGPAQTIYCSQRTAVFEQDELVITRKPKREAKSDPPFVAPRPVSDERRRNFYAVIKEHSIHVLNDGPECSKVCI